MGRIGEVGTTQAQISTKIRHGTVVCRVRNFPIVDEPLRARLPVFSVPAIGRRITYLIKELRADMR